MEVSLAFNNFGTSDHPPIIILHGFLGSSRNWLTMGKELSHYFNVFTIDLRNHGASSHTKSHTYDDMVGDLEHWLHQKNIGKVYLLGHSMGGKVAMAYACRNKANLKGLIVVDIAPKYYPEKNFNKEFSGMEAIPLAAIQSRTEAEKYMEPYIQDVGMRQFLLSNLTRGENGSFQWAFNLAVLKNSVQSVILNSLKNGEFYEGPTLFIKGELSNYIQPADSSTIHRHFPNAQLIPILNSGHNPHMENKDVMLQSIVHFKDRTL